MHALDLSSFGISEQRGFLCPYDVAEVTLPEEFEPIVEAASCLPRTLPTGQIRTLLERIPELNLTDFCRQASEAEIRTAFLRYTFLVQAYVWGEPVPAPLLPRVLAIPIWTLAGRLGQKPLLSYSAYVLDNWDRVDRSRPIALDNLYITQRFLGGQDETWFILVHVAIEARAGALLAEIPGLIDAITQRDAYATERALEAISRVWDDLISIFGRMRERCDPYIYFERVRPYIHGWKDNPAMKSGLIYEGVAETKGKPQVFRGQTGAQSSIIPTMDALLGIEHAKDPLRVFLDELHSYRPPSHRAFIDRVRSLSQLREFAISGSPALRAAYNACISRIAQFRTQHLEYAASYIQHQSRRSSGNDTAVGTGGTPFMRYLKKHRDDAAVHLLK